MRRTQAERSEATRARVLDATLELLVEEGWSRTTTQAVAARAGVSRGAQLHHFPTRAALVVSAVAHLAAKRHAEIRAELDRIPAAGPAGIEQAVGVLDRAFSGPLFYAALELWVAARTDADLRGALLPLEREIGRELHRLSADLLRAAGVDDPEDPRVRLLLDLTVDLLRGIGLATVLTGDERRRRRLLDAWSRTLTEMLTAEKEPA